MTGEASPPPDSLRGRLARIMQILAVLIIALWLVEIVDVLFLDDRLERQGIWPRRLDGLDGVLWAPFLHDTFGHLSANSIPLAILGGFVLLRGVDRWVWISAIVILGGGLATWVLARSGNHIGASGLVFGYLGYLLAAGFFERSVRAVFLAVVVLFGYGGLLWGVLPTAPGVSWEGHLFGVLAGGVAAWWVSGAARRSREQD